MSSPDPLHERDDPMNGQEEEEEEEQGDATMAGISDDSSEEGEDNPEDEAAIRDGFIVSDEGSESESAEEEEERPKKRRKKSHRRHHHRLDDDDREIIGELDTHRSGRRLKRLRRQAPQSADEFSEDDLGDTRQPTGDITGIFDEGPDDDDGSVGSFITDSDEAEGDEEARKAKRAERKKLQAQARSRVRGQPLLLDFDKNAWDEIHEVFGDGDDYDWALVNDLPEEEEDPKATKYTDVFEPSQIRDRLLTDDDDLIRAQDIPERMQLSNSTLARHSTLSTHASLSPEDMYGAALWITQRISTRKTKEFFTPDGSSQHLQTALVQAVTFVLKQLFIQEFEVPYIWTHKRDQICHFEPQDLKNRHVLLTYEELWRIYILGQKYRSLVTRRNALEAAYQRLRVNDPYYTDEILPHIDNVEMVADSTEWLNMYYKDRKLTVEDEFRFHDDEEEGAEATVKKHKMPSRISAYEVAKKSVIAKLAQGFGIAPTSVVQNFLSDSKIVFVEDYDLPPDVYADQFADPDPLKALSTEELLAKARLILSTELGKDPRLREEIRKKFKEHAQISVEPTQRGIGKIDENHPYFKFKYLQRKPIGNMLSEKPSGQFHTHADDKASGDFLHMLAAEAEHLVTITVEIPQIERDSFEKRLTEAFTSDGFSPSTPAWNQQRSLVVRDVMEQHLIPVGVKWTREYLREEIEESIATQAADRLRARVAAAPYRVDGEIASVVAVSWGKGDPHKDAISIVYLDQEGRLRESITLDNLVDNELRDEFLDLLKRRKPGVIVVAGFTIATAKLSRRVKEIVSGVEPAPTTSTGPNEPTPNVTRREDLGIPVIYMEDDVARIYYNSPRAAAEFAHMSPIARYCVGLARYTQNPLSEFAALGHDITTLTFAKDQNMVSYDKLLSAYERVLVELTNVVGVDINRAVADSYYAHLLPFVCGLGPRKAQQLIKKIGAMGGSLINRHQFIKNSLLTTKIFLNAVAFLRIPQEEMDLRKNQPTREEENVGDPLDDTRIHPEDYELARKMATDALELDEEDIHDYHPSWVVTLLAQDPEKSKKLSELNLDDFAVSLYDASEDMKRYILGLIKEELERPFHEERVNTVQLGPYDVVAMLTGANEDNLKEGFVVSATVVRMDRVLGARLRLDSGLEGYVPPEDIREQNLTRGAQTLALVSHYILDVMNDTFEMRFAIPRGLSIKDDQKIRSVPHEEHYWDYVLEGKHQEMKERKRRAEVDKSRRVIKHPNFHNFNTAQAESYLDKQQRGDVVIRPSSKGADHLAVTWKVDEKLFQHIDVTETGGQLLVDSTHTYADLDELIVNHVQAMARRVEELKAHERFKGGSEDELAMWLKQQLAANPGKSMYGFTLNRKKPGHFILGFLANKNSTVQTWPVRVTPEAYYLFDAAAVGVPELCDAFKVRHLHETNNALATAGSKTPYGAGGRTPARPGYATPGHASVRVPSRTPNTYGGTTPAPSSHGFLTPRPPAMGMHPARQAMVQQSSGWNQSGWS